MATATATSTLTLKEAVDFIVAEVRRTMQPPSEIVNDSIVNDLDSAAFKHLVRVGLIQEVHDFLHRDRTAVARGGNATTQPRTGYRGDGSNPRTRSVLAAISMEDAEGKIKPIEDFTLADTEALHVTCKKFADGWDKRSKWAAQASKLLKASKRSHVAALSAKSVLELQRLAAEAWS